MFRREEAERIRSNEIIIDDDDEDDVRERETTKRACTGFCIFEREGETTTSRSLSA